MKWIGHMLDIGIEYYIVEKDYSYEYGQKREIIKMYHVHQDEESSTVLDPVNSESYEKLYLWQCVESKARVTDKKANGKSAIAIPIMTKNEVVAILSIRNNAVVPDSKEIIPSEQMKDFEDTLSVFNIAVDSIRRENFGQIVQANLAGEKIDDESRVGMLFPSLMLTQIRDSISNIDQSGMAEIKSYRKPPAVIHKVMKCVLYIFGKKKSQVAKWTDMIKYLNMDMLKQIVEYDPTAVQKKKRFVRVEKVLKTIPRGDIRKQGSKPTKDLFDWLIVSLELRKAAVAARKRHLETAGKSADVKLEDGPEEEGSSEESGDDEPEETQGVEKSE
ncbi:hypothetical protein O9G_003915 [Rozella allomycis CSF55]|uniref:Uncharacterized protein n=1 Tax=Rozella allomycis (strain CSF55) TaxID=988480 RepID=A0A075AXG4_ROZAC|nr:hypothetical protein O9G_003915 [Rozella allomycis CSF55]|eukprot:EPZ33412.1 hypothetical protein O9G_003915 [Rozella allomycis CSF55]